MSWLADNSLRTRINTSAVPLVLCGPILRRVEPASVSVFVALKYARDITLEVFMGSTVVMQGARRTVQLGEHLHVALVTATASAGQGTLVGGAIYRYNLSFVRTSTPHASDTAAQSQDLAALGLLSDPVNLGFVPGELPSFALPPNDLNRLRLIHGSCRKPHGESLDALEGLEMMIRPTRNDPFGRPHQLFLGGDQIYADDVADALLLMLMDAAETLLGWQEVEIRRRPGGEFDDQGYTVTPKGLAAPAIPVRDVMPGGRSPTARKLCGFSVHPAENTALGIDRSHLLFFGEYVAMYLFAWSRALWPFQLPQFADVYPGLATSTTTVHDGKTRKKIAARNKALLAETGRLEVFRGTLDAVRRALANVPTYMMFDDHEITDDWFINRGWCQRVLSKPLGRRVLENGLAAFAVFQAWGNVPGRFTTGQFGRELLDRLAEWSDLQRRISNGQSGLDTAATAARNRVNHLIGMPADFLQLIQSNRRLVHPPETLDWHFHVEGPGYEVVVLDTRTHRAYPGAPRDFAALISDVGLRAQISDLGVSRAEVTLVVSPVPVIGVPLIEHAQEFMSFTVQQRYENDAEAWALQDHPFEYLLSLLAQRSPRQSPISKSRGRVVLLSGDVHYGFAARVQYWSVSPFDPDRTFEAPGIGRAEMVAVQFTSSSLKNEITKTRLLHGLGLVPGRDELPVAQVAAWNNQARTRKVIGAIVSPDGGSADLRTTGHPTRSDLGPLVDGVLLTADPHWSYRIDFQLAETDVSGPAPDRPRDFSPRFVPVPPPSPQNRDQRRAALAAYLQMAHNHEDYTERWGDGKEIVGVNNLGEISFIWNSQEQAAVQHLWWRLRRHRLPDLPLTMFPLTKHVVSLRLDDPKYREPSGRVNP